MFIKSSSGFTLIEVLVVMNIVAVLLLLTIPVSLSAIEKHEESKFIEIFEYDLLYTQGLATTTNESVRIIFFTDSYEIVKGETDSTMAVRNIPKHIKIHTRLRPVIAFDRSGRIRDLQKGRIEIETKHSKYHVVFPLGKGRCSIVKL